LNNTHTHTLTPNLNVDFYLLFLIATLEIFEEWKGICL
jgi:hypothetical protein